MNVTFFSRNAMPTNLLTVAEWRNLAHHSQASSWMAAVRSWAKSRGGALVLRADGSLRVFTLREDKIQQRTYKPGSWKWDSEQRMGAR